MSNDRKYYYLADALKMSLTRDNKTGKISGEKTFKIGAESFELPLTCRVENSYETMAGDVILILKVKGNFRMMAVATGRELWLFYVNLAKMTSEALQTPEALKPSSVADYVTHMTPAIVRSFTQTGKTWKEAAFTA